MGGSVFVSLPARSSWQRPADGRPGRSALSSCHGASGDPQRRRRSGLSQVARSSESEHAVVADGKTLQIPQTLATAEDPEHRHQQQVHGRDADPTPHPSIRNRFEEADQVEIGCRQCGFGQGEGAIPPTSTHAGCCGQGACDILSISPGPPRACRPGERK
jgi:hypothetical protein